MMKRYLAWLMRCIVVSAMLASVMESRGEVVFGSPVKNMAEVRDPKARAALEAIGRLQAQVRELKMGEYKVSHHSAKGVGVDTGPFLLRQDGSFYRQIKHNLPGSPLDGEQGLGINNGKVLWSISHLTTRSQAMLLGRMRKEEQEQIQRTAPELRKLKITKYDVARLREAGMPENMTFGVFVWINPLRPVNPATVRLTGETPATWTFTAESYPRDGNYKVIATFSKTDGILRKIVRPPHGPWHATITEINRVQINPEPPLSPELFTYTPPAGVEVRDMTEHRLKSWNAMKTFDALKSNPGLKEEFLKSWNNKAKIKGNHGTSGG